MASPAASADVQPLRPPAVRVQVEERARTGMPLRAVVKHVVQLVQVPVVAVDDEHVTIDDLRRSTLPGSPPSIQCGCVIASSGIG